MKSRPHGAVFHGLIDLLVVLSAMTSIHLVTRWNPEPPRSRDHRSKTHEAKAH